MSWRPSATCALLMFALFEVLLWISLGPMWGSLWVGCPAYSDAMTVSLSSDSWGVLVGPATPDLTARSRGYFNIKVGSYPDGYLTQLRRSGPSEFDVEWLYSIGVQVPSTLPWQGIWYMRVSHLFLAVGCGTAGFAIDRRFVANWLKTVFRRIFFGSFKR